MDISDKTKYRIVAKDSLNYKNDVLDTVYYLEVSVFNKWREFYIKYIDIEINTIFNDYSPKFKKLHYLKDYYKKYTEEIENYKGWNIHYLPIAKNYDKFIYFANYQYNCLKASTIYDIKHNIDVFINKKRNQDAKKALELELKKLKEVVSYKIRVI